MGNSKHIKLMKEIEPSIFLVLALGILVIGLLIASDWMWRNQIQRNVPIYDNIMQVRIYLTKGQLLLERMLSGDTSIRIEDIWPYYERSEIALRDSMNGRSTIIQLAGLPPKDNEILSQLEQLEGTLKRSRGLSLDRWKTGEVEESRDIPDERTLFYQLESTIDAINYRILGNIGQMMNDQKKAHSITIVLWLLILSVVCGIIFFNDKKRKRAERALQKAHDELEQRVKERTVQLKHINEQLSLEIKERMQMQETMRKERDNAQRYLDLAGVIFVSINKKGEVTIINKKGCAVLGYNEAEIVGENWFENFIPEWLREDLIPVSKNLLNGDIESAEYHENPILTKTGEERMIAWNNSLLKDDGGNIIGHLSSGEDITERKQAERDRERLLTELEAKNKELESFVYSITHDLKTPLVSLQGFSSLLQRQLHDQLDEEGKHYMERIQSNVVHMASLISDLLELSRIGRVVGPMEEIDVAALLREIQQDLAVELVEAGAELVAQEPLPVVHVDPGRIRQVFTNLIENALKFRSRDRPLRIEVGCKEERGSYRIHVADNGIGIAHQYQEQIFNPFRKLDPKTKGMGIGMALVKKIVESHGGRVWVESETAEVQEGVGATFYFTLPRREES